MDQVNWKHLEKVMHVKQSQKCRILQMLEMSGVGHKISSLLSPLVLFHIGGVSVIYKNLPASP